ncbi:uncharacterized protein LOC105420199 isoform X2 [Amborella trichopoda]|uniref:uncharacterized protein LOC105420199 isoform X2 n=1 Tax=Amborella trichopoda TaxID=13333 RepID=UPI0009BDA861|nr:uncharacterized protein LOC105420199 isoform X2 [Amborella trichopoda]|eukprot:XP_020519382.1 uncharacterized protein LOC105420199 isoform X2 [Amborella trichopoda]
MGQCFNNCGWQRAQVDLYKLLFIWVRGPTSSLSPIEGPTNAPLFSVGLSSGLRFQFLQPFDNSRRFRRNCIFGWILYHLWIWLSAIWLTIDSAPLEGGDSVWGVISLIEDHTVEDHMVYIYKRRSRSATSRVVL